MFSPQSIADELQSKPLTALRASVCVADPTRAM